MNTNNIHRFAKAADAYLEHKAANSAQAVHNADYMMDMAIDALASMTSYEQAKHGLLTHHLASIAHGYKPAYLVREAQQLAAEVLGRAA